MNSVSLNNNANMMNEQLKSNQSELLKKKLEAAKNTEDNKEIRDAAEQFEAVFINMMLKTMRSTIPEDQGYIEKSHASKMYESMLDEEISNGMAKGGGFGLSDMIYKSLLKRTEIENQNKVDEVKNTDIKDTNK